MMLKELKDTTKVNHPLKTFLKRKGDRGNRVSGYLRPEDRIREDAEWPHFLLRIVTLIMLLGIVSCEKVIEVDLNDAEPIIVIEGNLSYDDRELEVRLSKSGSYFDNTSYDMVNGAEVTLEAGPGYRLEAEETEDGIYRLTELPLLTGTTYRLKVVAEGQEYTAVSTLPAKVRIDSLGYEYESEGRFFEGGYRPILLFADPADTENYYRVKVYRNGVLFNSRDDIIIFEDSDLNGRGVQVRLRRQLLDAGDTLKVQLYSIDRNTWEYFNSLRDLINLNPGSPAPANPVSYFTNGAMGYFSAWTLSEKEVTVEE